LTAPQLKTDTLLELLTTGAAAPVQSHNIKVLYNPELHEDIIKIVYRGPNHRFIARFCSRLANLDVYAVTTQVCMAPTQDNRVWRQWVTFTPFLAECHACHEVKPLTDFSQRSKHRVRRRCQRLAKFGNTFMQGTGKIRCNDCWPAGRAAENKNLAAIQHQILNLSEGVKLALDIRVQATYRGQVIDSAQAVMPVTSTIDDESIASAAKRALSAVLTTAQDSKNRAMLINGDSISRVIEI
jgi:hypothetical protein